MKYVLALALVAGFCLSPPADARKRRRAKKAAIEVVATEPPPAAAPSPAEAPPPPPVEPPAQQSENSGIPILSWQQERELESTFRQALVHLYLQLLSNPNDYGGPHSTEIPNGVPDWAMQRESVKEQLWRRQAAADRKLRRRSGPSLAMLKRMEANKQDFRPEHLVTLAGRLPRIDDATVRVSRVQPLGGDRFRLDYSVELALRGFTQVTHFRSVDVEHIPGQLKVPMRVLLDVSVGERGIFGGPKATDAPPISTPGAVSLPAPLSGALHRANNLVMRLKPF